MMVQSLIDRLRPLVGIKGWDYIVLWKLSNVHCRCIEWLDCCCGGSENTENGGEDLISFPSSSSSSTNLPCRDIMFPHARMASCDLLDQLPSSIILIDSGVHAQTLLSNQVSWNNYTRHTESSLSQETIGTRVLIPLSLPLGLVELFVTKQIPEDEQVIDFIRAQCSFFVQQQTNAHPMGLFHQQGKENLHDLPNDISIDRIHLCTPPLDPLHGHHNNNDNDIFLEGITYESNIFTPSIENGFQDAETAHQGNPSRWMESSDQMNDDSFLCETNRSDESDPNDDEDEAKYRRRTGKGPQSKNLMAERKRRKKLNDRLYSLRALVPKISKLDRASILGDAIDYVKELQKQVKDLQDELEDQSEDEETRKTGQEDAENNNIVHQNGSKRAPKHGHNGLLKHSCVKDNTNDKVQQMEPQVEVFQLDGNEFFVKVFCEHKFGGFVRLMEALSSLGFEVTNVNATRHTCLVSSIFKVERKNNDMVQADHVKESLLELTRNPSRMWANNIPEESENCDNRDNNYRRVCSRQMNSHHLPHLQH